MRLRWPASSPVLDITIPNSQLGNTESLQSNAIIRENRGLQPITFNSGDWPINVTNHYKIQTMNATEKNNLLTFLIASAGDQILLTDHDGYIWNGLITTAIPEIITMQDDCSYDAEFDFMGSH